MKINLSSIKGGISHYCIPGVPLADISSKYTECHVKRTLVAVFSSLDHGGRIHPDASRTRRDTMDTQGEITMKILENPLHISLNKKG
jgi:hypothetical protein